jgi:hypothetical protein
MAFKMKGSPMKRNFGIGSGSPAKFQGAFIDGKRVSYDTAMDAIESGEGNVELTNKEARKYAEEQGDLDWLNKVRKEDRQRIANMTEEERKEHRRLLSQDAARQSNVEKLNWREGLGYKLTDKEKEERAGSTYDPVIGEYGDQNVDLIGVKAGRYEFPDLSKSSPMDQVDNEYQEGWTGEETTEQSLENFKNDYEKAMSEGNEEMAEMIMQDIRSAQRELEMKHAKGESPMKQKYKAYKRVVTHKRPKQVARKKARLVEKPKKKTVVKDMTKPKKKTGKISTKTMELE